jgi:hypothetical protein
LSDAAKVDSERNQTSVIKRRRGTKHDFIVHCAAAKWMRVKHKSRGARCLPRLFENCFELTVLYRDEKIAGGVHRHCRLSIANCRL